jgi:hypothetical protein
MADVWVDVLMDEAAEDWDRTEPTDRAHASDARSPGIKPRASVSRVVSPWFVSGSGSGGVQVEVERLAVGTGTGSSKNPITKKKSWAPSQQG